MASSFVHLHLHTQYSLLDAIIKIPDLIQRAKIFGMPAVAMTDHGNLFGAMEFYAEAKKQKIKPIIGCEVYMAPGSRFSRQPTQGRNPIEDPFHHLTLLCMDNIGYRNLCRLITIANFEGFYYKPRIDKEVLKTYNEGLIALSGCLSGEIAGAILQGQEQKVIDLIHWYKDTFRDRFYFELQENRISEQKKVNEALIRYAARLDVPLVGTNDCHYLNAQDAVHQEVMLCVQTGHTLKDDSRMKFGSNEFYFKSAEAMREVFSYCPEAVQSTLNIADQCNLDFELSKIYLPHFELPDQQNLDDHLRQKAKEGLEAYLAKKNIPLERKRYLERLEHELDIISKTGFAGYFLIVADFVNYATRKGIPVGPGRGSAAGSLVAFFLRITNIDPIPHNLIFERFLNPERVSLPDMDIDFCMNRRDEVIQYVTEKYGKENVAQIITFGKMQAKAAIRDVGRVYSFPYGEVDKIAKLVPNVLNITLEEAIAGEQRLKSLYEKDERVRQLLNTAIALEGLYRHASIHAAGIVISNRPLVEYMPIFRGKDGEVVTSFDMKHVEKIGLIKFDFLGLKTLTLIDRVVKKTSHSGQIDFHDKKVYELFSRGDTIGIFQFESSGMRDLLMKLKPARFEDIIAANALFRPGPMNRLDEFIDRRHGRIPVHYTLPQLKDILQDSYGIILYQEQVMKIANVLANYSLGEADILRKAMGKKNPKEMQMQKERFLKGAIRNKIDGAIAENIFDLMAKFAEYGFNKSHATAYAYIAFQTAWFKTYHRVLFMAELLTTELEDTDKMALYIQDAKEAGIEILPPDVQKSQYEFSVEDGKIRFGLGAIKNVGAIAIESILEAKRTTGRFHSFAHFFENIDLRKVNRKVVESLIKAGAFDSIHQNRAQLMDSLDVQISAAQTHQEDREVGQYNMFSFSGVIPGVEDWPSRRRLRFEKEAIGLYLSGHPLSSCLGQIEKLSTHDTRTITQAQHKGGVRVGGVVSAVRETVTKRGDKMAFVTLEDLKGTLDVIVFSDLYFKTSDLLKSDDPLLVTGSVELSEEAARIIATAVEDLSQAAEARISRICIRLNAEALRPAELQKLKFVLHQHLGACPVLLKLNVKKPSHEVQMLMGLKEPLRVSPTESLVSDVENLLGRGTIYFE